MKSVIIDDEPLAVELLKDFIGKVDYLVKPIPFHRFLKSVVRAQQIFNPSSQTAVNTELFRHLKLSKTLCL